MRRGIRLGATFNHNLKSKIKMKMIRKMFRAASAVSVGAIIALSAAKASAQVSSPTLFPLTNMPVTLSSNVVNFMTNSAGQAQVIPLTKNSCLSVSGRVNTTLGAGTEVLSGSFSTDGTTFGVAPFTLTAPLTTTLPTTLAGQPAVSVWTNWSQAYLSSFAAVTFNQVTNLGPGIVTNNTWTANRSVLNTATY